MGYEIVK